MSSTTKILIVNADDFGNCPNYPSHALKSVAAYQIAIGLHLNLTKGRPVTTDLSRIRSLVDE